MNTLVYIFGPSCSGKSTLAKALHKSLGTEWQRFDRDKFDDKKANAILDEKVDSIKKRVIIDAQIPWREKREGELYFLVLPPLQTLLERDTQRTWQLKRDEKHAKDCREYVLETHQILAEMAKEKFNHCFDSSIFSVEDEVSTIKSFIKQ